MPTIQIISTLRKETCPKCYTNKGLLHVTVNSRLTMPILCGTCLLKAIIERLTLKFTSVENCNFCNIKDTTGIYFYGFFYCHDCEVALYDRIASYLEG